MALRNRLKEIFTEWGFERVIPSDQLLKDLGMERKRFYQLVDNRGAKEMTVSERVRLEAWLRRIHISDTALFHEVGKQLKMNS